ncbi:MAG: pilus assembly protein TadG-related protein [Anaerolineae bacterium]
MRNLRSVLRSELGQALPYVALMFITILVVVGFAVDIGLTFVEKARLQTAADAAALAGSQALGNSGICDPNAKDAAENYLQLNGFDTVNDTWSTSCSNDSYGKLTIFNLNLSRPSDTAFMGLLGIRTISLGAAATSQYATTMLDVIISVDTTGSMNAVVSGTPKIDALKAAAVDMVQDLNMQPSDPLTLRAGLVRFDGEVCYDTDDQDVWQWDADPDPADNDPSIACVDDTGQKSGDTPGASLGSLGLNQALQPLTANQGQLVSKINLLAAVGGSGTKGGSGVSGADAAFEWTGPRENARRFLVLMTDGNNQIEGRQWRKAMVQDWHSDHGDVANGAHYDQMSIDAANALKAKGVEIFTIGFELSGTTSCPADPKPGDVDATDQVLIDMSSSSTGSCDHYYTATVGTIGTALSDIAAKIGNNRLIG